MGEKSVAIVFPHHLMEDHPAAGKTSRFILVEDQLFFGDPVFRLRFHRNKLILHRLQCATTTTTSVQGVLKLNT